MSLRTTLQKLIRRDPAASLRERAAELHARIPASKPQAEQPPPTSGDADAELLALASEWEAARNAYDEASQRQMEITTAAERDNRPGRAPEGSGPDWQAWFERCQEWRERTGIDAAEEASADACRALARVEDRITALPATTPDGLRLKARVAERNDEIGVEWPEGLGESLTRDLLAFTTDDRADEVPSADAELLALGSQFDAARMTEIAACEDCNAAQREANRHMPERPACLFYRASDERLNVFRHLLPPESLNGVEINITDVERLRRIMPMTHEVLRPIRHGERAHRDHPGRKFDIVAHPEAQARAVEIVTAWDAWRTERARVQSEHFPKALDDAANEAGDEVAALAARIAALPALTADGFRVKLRALSHYRRDTLLAEIPEEPDPDQLLSHSLWRDAQGMLPAPTPANVLTAGILDLWRDWAAKEEAEVYDEALQQRRFGLIDAAEALPATIENMGVKALALAWLEYVDHWRPKSGRGSYTTDGRLAIDIHTAASQTQAEAPTATPAARHEPNLIGMLNLASASLEELRTVRDMADCIGGVAYAHAWGPRCQDRVHVSGAPNFNAAGKLVLWVGDTLTAVEAAADKEAKRRTPNFRDDDEIHLSMLAETIIDNGDPDEIEAFAGKLLAHAKAEREGR